MLDRYTEDTKQERAVAEAHRLFEARQQRGR